MLEGAVGWPRAFDLPFREIKGFRLWEPWALANFLVVEGIGGKLGNAHGGGFAGFKENCLDKKSHQRYEVWAQSTCLRKPVNYGYHATFLSTIGVSIELNLIISEFSFLSILKSFVFFLSFF